MAEEQTNDANIEQPVTVQGDTGQPATDQSETSQPATDEKGPIPYDRFQQVNEAKKAAEQQLILMQQQFQQILASQQAGKPSNNDDPFETFMQQAEIGKDGYLTPDDVRKINAFNRQQAQIAAESNQQEQWLASHPDYIGIVQTPSGQISEHLSKAIKNDPALGLKLRKNWDPILAYHAARAEMTAKPANTPHPPSPLPTSRPPQGISAAVGGGSSTDIGGQMAAMTDDQVRAYLHSRSR